MIFETELFYLVVAILFTFFVHVVFMVLGGSGGNHRNSHP